jgi:hypothetical protein
MSPYIAFGLFVAASVFIPKAKMYGQYDASFISLQFIRSAMLALKETHPVTGSFLLQLDIALESNGLNSDQSTNPTTTKALSEVRIPPKEDSSPRSTEPSIMDNEFRKYSTIPISLEGILPAQIQTRKQIQTLTPIADYGTAELLSGLGQTLDFEFDLGGDPLPSLAIDETYTMQTDISQDEFPYDYLQLDGTSQLNDSGLPSHMDPLQLEFP